jgi:hypothetical protein
VFGAAGICELRELRNDGLRIHRANYPGLPG